MSLCCGMILSDGIWEDAGVIKCILSKYKFKIYNADPYLSIARLMDYLE